MATPKKVEFVPQKGILVNPYNVCETKEEEPSDFMVKISYLLLSSENSIQVQLAFSFKKLNAKLEKVKAKANES